MTKYKITQHTENQENLKQPADIKNKMTETLKLSDQEFNTTTIKMLQQVRTSKDKQACWKSTERYNLYIPKNRRYKKFKTLERRQQMKEKLHRME